MVLNLYAKLLVAGIALALAAGAGYYVRDLRADRDAARAELSGVGAALDAQTQLAKDVLEGQRALSARLDKAPKAAPVQQVIHENPSGCDLPGPVADSLRDQAEQGRAVRGSR